MNLKQRLLNTIIQLKLGKQTDSIKNQIQKLQQKVDELEKESK